MSSFCELVPGSARIAYGILRRSARIGASAKSPTTGTFSTSANMPRGFDAPRAVKCFELSVEMDEARERERRFGRVAIEYLDLPKSFPADRDSALRFRMIDTRTNEQRRGVGDVVALVVQSPGGWRTRQLAVAHDDGTYELTIHPPSPGAYLLYIESASLQLPMANPNHIGFDAR